MHHIKLLIGLIACDRTGDHIRTGVIAVEDDLINTVGILCSVGHQTLLDDQARIASELSLCIAFGGIDTLDLHHFHLHCAALIHVDLCHRIEQTLARAVAGAVMLFDILDLAPLPTKKRWIPSCSESCVPQLSMPQPATIHDIAVLADVKIVVDNFFESASGSRRPGYGHSHSLCPA